MDTINTLYGASEQQGRTLTEDENAKLKRLAPNQQWSLDFVSDQLTDGRRLRTLTVVDNCTRECQALSGDGF